MATIADNNINDLIFDYEGFNSAITSILRQITAVSAQDGQTSKRVTFLPLDTQNLSKNQTPCFIFEVTETPNEQSMDNWQLYNQSNVDIQVDVYTSGNHAKSENIALRKSVIKALIAVQDVGEYRFLGMNVEDDRFVNSIITDITRGVVRLSCVVDNHNKVITKRRY